MTKLKIIAIVLTLIIIQLAPANAFMARLTSYTGSEDGNFRSCTGERLHEGMVAADLNYYKLGQKLLIEGETFVVADCGSAIKGPKHFDVYVSSMKKMEQRGTVYADVQVLTPNNPHLTTKSTQKPLYMVKKDPSSRAADKLVKDSSCFNSKNVIYSSKSFNKDKMFNRIEKTQILVCDNE